MLEIIPLIARANVDRRKNRRRKNRRKIGKRSNNINFYSVKLYNSTVK